MTIEQRSIDTALLGAYTDRRGGRAVQEMRNQKRLMLSILEIICLFRVYLVFLLLALESTQDADSAKDGSKS